MARISATLLGDIDRIQDLEAQGSTGDELERLYADVEFALEDDGGNRRDSRRTRDEDWEAPRIRRARRGQRR